MIANSRIPNQFPIHYDFAFPNEFIDDKELKSPACFRLYAALNYYIENGKNNPSFKDLSEIIYVKNYHSIKRALDELELAGWIKIYDNGGGLAPRYEVFDEKQLPIECISKSSIGFYGGRYDREQLKQVNELTAKRR